VVSTTPVRHARKASWSCGHHPGISSFALEPSNLNRASGNPAVGAWIRLSTPEIAGLDRKDEHWFAIADFAVALTVSSS
jgi:hypothetical protein